MNVNDDPTLLRRYAAQCCQDSFAELVQRHLGLVYHAALRVGAGDTQLAEDAAQATFTLLAARAAKLCDHPELAGWLHATACLKARELRRGELRRHQREQTATSMNDLHGEPTNDESWQRLRPLIDEVLLELKPEDRAAVLLRFFEGRAFTEVGVAFRLGENAARMRVDRALERLREALARRGVASTGAALGMALSVPATLAMPAGLSSKIAGTVLAGGVAGGVVGHGILYFMTTSKMIVVAAGVVAAVAVGTAVRQWNGREVAEAEASALRERTRELQAAVADLESRLATETDRVGQMKRGVMPTLTQSHDLLPGGDSPLVASITSEMVDERFNRARALARSGHYDEALQQYLWCYDTGMPQFRSYAGVRSAMLLEVAALGAKFPAALAAIRERRDAIETRVLKSSTDLGAFLDYGPLNKALGEEDKTLVVFDMLSAGDERRSVLGRQVADQLLDAQRYEEILQVKPYGSMVLGFDLLSRRNSVGSDQAGSVDRTRSYAIQSAVKDIEALAGAGSLPSARTFVGKVLAFDDTPETRALLASHLERAGHPELLAP